MVDEYVADRVGADVGDIKPDDSEVMGGRHWKDPSATAGAGAGRDDCDWCNMSGSPVG